MNPLAVEERDIDKDSSVRNFLVIEQLRYLKILVYNFISAVEERDIDKD